MVWYKKSSIFSCWSPTDQTPQSCRWKPIKTLNTRKTGRPNLGHFDLKIAAVPSENFFLRWINLTFRKYWSLTFLRSLDPLRFFLWEIWPCIPIKTERPAPRLSSVKYNCCVDAWNHHPHSTEYCRNMSEIFPIFHCNWNIVAIFLSNIAKYFVATLHF